MKRTLHLLTLSFIMLTPCLQAAQASPTAQPSLADQLAAAKLAIAQKDLFIADLKKDNKLAEAKILEKRAQFLFHMTGIVALTFLGGQLYVFQPSCPKTAAICGLGIIAIGVDAYYESKEDTPVTPASKLIPVAAIPPRPLPTMLVN